MNVHIGILVFPNVQQLDLTGAYEVGAGGARSLGNDRGGVTAGIDFALALVGEMAGCFPGCGHFRRYLPPLSLGSLQ